MLPVFRSKTLVSRQHAAQCDNEPQKETAPSTSLISQQHAASNNCINKQAMRTACSTSPSIPQQAATKQLDTKPTFWARSAAAAINERLKKDKVVTGRCLAPTHESINQLDTARTKRMAKKGTTQESSRIFDPLLAHGCVNRSGQCKDNLQRLGTREARIGIEILLKNFAVIDEPCLCDRYIQRAQHPRAHNRSLVERKAEKLPDELILLVLQNVVLQNFKQVCLHTEHDLTLAAGLMAGDAHVDILHLAGSAILEDSIIRLSIDFQGPGLNRQAIVADWAMQLRPSIHHLDLRLHNALQKYPVKLYKATDGIQSLLNHFPNLRSLQLVLQIDEGFHYSSRILDRPCTKGLDSQTITYRKAIEDLVATPNAVRPKLEVSFDFRYHQEERSSARRQFDMSVKLNGRSASEIVEEARKKDRGCIQEIENSI